MKPAHLTPFAREDLARRLKKWKSFVREPPPPCGWVRAIREALGMTAAQLGERLRISQAGVAALELSERRGRIKLTTLRKIAAKLDCDLVYALVPRKPLDELLRDRQRRLATRELRIFNPHSRLPAEEYRDLIEAYAKQIKPRRVWEE